MCYTPYCTVIQVEKVCIPTVRMDLLTTEISKLYHEGCPVLCVMYAGHRLFRALPPEFFITWSYSITVARV